MFVFRLSSFRLAGPGAIAAALAGATGIALAGALLWGLVGLLFHVQLSVLGVLIGAGVGATVARFRPVHLATMIAGGVLAVAGCAIGTVLGEVFYLLSQHVALSDILGHLNLLLRSFPRNVGVLGVLFYAIAAFAAVWLPWRTRAHMAAPAADAAAANPATPADATAADTTATAAPSDADVTVAATTETDSPSR
jgi:hypothetical protein